MLAPVPVDRVVRVLGPADYRTMPWKNGGGRTTEIAAAPRGADLAGFTWRISVAEIERDGPFSAFPGIDRTLVLLAGNGMRLTGPQCAIELGAPFAVAAFAGEQALDCALTGGPTRDFNLMVRRHAARGRLAVVRATQTFTLPDAWVCFAAAGPVECAFADAPPCVVAEEHTLVADGAAALRAVRVHPLAPDGAAIVCGIEPAQGSPG